MSQSPQTGQFNSYGRISKSVLNLAQKRLNPLKRVNSILTQRQRLRSYSR